jgi:hypothetical protein
VPTTGRAAPKLAIDSAERPAELPRRKKRIFARRADSVGFVVKLFAKPLDVLFGIGRIARDAKKANRLYPSRVPYFLPDFRL